MGAPFQENCCVADMLALSLNAREKISLKCTLLITLTALENTNPLFFLFGVEWNRVHYTEAATGPILPALDDGG
jgi:hypothetical protein